MALNSSGRISLAGATTGESIALELALSATGQISLNDTAVRTLAGIASGAISMPANFWGKSNGVPFGEATFEGGGVLTTTYSFVVPTGVTEICAVCVGSGCNQDNPGSAYGGSGGALSYSNGIPVTAGETLTVVAGGSVQSPATRNPGGDSYIARGGTILLLAKGANPPTPGLASSGVGAVKYSGGYGASFESGGGGAAGYAGDGGNALSTSGVGAAAPAGGGGGSGGSSANQSGGGGGVGLIVQGASGAGAIAAGQGGFGGSGGQNGDVRGNGWGGIYGGGGGAHGDNTVSSTGRGTGGWGGVRIIYGGTSKNYPFNSAP